MYTQITTADYKEAIEKTEEGILLCSKKLCPHCKNMGKVMEKFAAKKPNVKLLTVDSEEDPDVMKAIDAERVPTIIVIKGGKIVAQKTGLMNPKDLDNFYTNA